MGSVDYLGDIARTLDMFFKGLEDCGLLTTYSVQFQNRVFDISVKQKFRLIINEFMQNLQKLLQNVCVVGEDEITVSLSTRNGVLPIIMKINETPNVDYSTQFDCNGTPYLSNDDLPLENTTEDISIANLLNTDSLTETALDTIIDTKPTVGNTSINSGPVENILGAVYPIKKNAISEPWQLSILNNEREDIAIDAITEVMTKNTMKDVGWQCDMCSKVFDRMQMLQEHCREEHNGTGCFECNLCGARVMTKLSLKRHIRSHSGLKAATCSICGKTFKRADYLATHYKLHAGTRTHLCGICGKEFASNTSLKLHEKVHSDRKDYICQQCNKSFTRRDKLRDHMLRHLNIKRFQCSVCDKRYAEKRDLKTHLRVHSDSQSTMNAKSSACGVTNTNRK